jgi:hypothetical protein
MNCKEIVSNFKTWFLNLFNCTNKPLEEVFVPLSDNKEVEIIIPEVDNSLIIKPNVEKREEVDEYIDIPVLLPIEQLPYFDNEEYGFEQELEDIDNSSGDDDDGYSNYYHE